MFCTQCGNQCTDTAKFCIRCGNLLQQLEVQEEEYYDDLYYPQMNEMFPCGLFQPPGSSVFGVVDDAIVYGQDYIPFEDIDTITLVTAPTPLTNGVAQMYAYGKVYMLVYVFKDRERAIHALDYAKRCIEAAHGVEKGYLYSLSAHTGTTLEVYDTYLILNFMRTGGFATVTANVYSGGTTGGKRINFTDLTAIQFKEPAGVTVGFIQFSYPGSHEFRGGVVDAINDENAIPVSPQNLAIARQIVDYIEQRRVELRTPQPAIAAPAISAADELRKFKELMDMGVITQEEFDAKKKQLLGL